MRIALDATYSLGRELTGVGVYSREIAYGLAAAHADSRFVFCYRPHRFASSFHEQLPRNVSRSLLLELGPLAPADLFHGLNQRLPSRRQRRAVSTFHDLFVMTGEYSTPEFRRRFTDQARHAAECSDLIICVSAFTAAQVEDLLHISPARLRVVHHGVRPVESDDAARENIVLSVGAIQSRKNTERLVQAFAGTKPGWRLILAGSSGYGAERTMEAIRLSGRASDIQVTGYVSAAELAKLYRTASLFVFPSLDEGFGIPLLEAMANGLPVLASDIPVFREVCGESAVFVPPHCTDELAHQMQKLMDDAEARSDLIARGIEHSRKFTWERAVEQTWRVYQELS